MNDVWPPNSDFWTTQFPGRTSNRTTPYLFKNLIPATAANPDQVLAGLAAMRRAHAENTPSIAKARVYVGEQRRDDLAQSVLSTDGWDGGAFVPWMQSLVGADRFSLVLNNLETTNPELAASLAQFLRSLFEGWGVPIGGAEQVAFAGNYSGTAFGIHEGGEDAFLCHLGPGTKNFYCWAPELYAKLTGGQDPTFGDYQHLLEQGECFVMEPGDALFLPKRVFHVGRQDTFSISVAVPFYTYPEDRLLRISVLPELLEEVLGEDPDDAFGVQSPMYDAQDAAATAARRLTERARTALTTISERLEDHVARHVQSRLAALRSNGGWEPQEDDLARTTAAAAFDADQVRPGARLAIPAPYELHITGPQQAYLRGVAVPCDTTLLSAQQVADLNARRTLTIPDDEALRSVITALGTTGGLHLTTDSTTPEAAA